MIETSIDQIFTNVRLQAGFVKDRIQPMLSMNTVNGVNSQAFPAKASAVNLDLAFFFQN